ncbi:hypothetical protein [Richelia sinica]|uniref:hypothetical protein n=1 Tax=Richelia sinica TaxID=1357545 RepID=UPI0016858E8A|nr:hypothetical protein [Richelia sinica]MBD2666696.1 hypothetical protein [Richelia sinica FACHB-800]
MPGTLNSGRRGGNPNLKTHQYISKGGEPLAEKLTLRVTSSMMKNLKDLGKNYLDFVREAIAEKIERHQAAELTRTETTELMTTDQPQQHTQTNQEVQPVGTDPTLPEQGVNPGKRRKASQNPKQTPVKPRSQTRSRKSTGIEKTTEQGQ